jgi:hypothetical protein
MDTGICSKAIDSIIDDLLKEKIAIKEKLNRKIPEGKREKLTYRLKILEQKIRESNSDYYF